MSITPESSGSARRPLPIRRRLTLSFATGFVTVAAAFATISYLVVRNRLRVDLGDQDLLDDLGLPSQGGEPPVEFVTEEGGPTPRLVQLVRDQVVDDVLATLLVWLAVALAFAAILAVGLGAAIAHRFVTPIRSIARTARQINEDRLDARVAYRGSNDELGNLAQTIDDMLERVESGYDAQRQFAAMASHELRTPLARLRAAVDLARRDHVRMPEERFVDIVDDTSRDAARLVERLLDLSRSREGVLSIDDVDISQVIERSVTRRGDLARQREVVVTTHVDDGDHTVRADIELLTSAFDNMLDNAIRHNITGGAVIVDIAGDDSSVTVVVANDGETITEQDVSNWSSPFRRGTPNPDREGHGLGTSIVRTVIDAHHGRLDVTPRPVGGVAVAARIPRRRADEAIGGNRNLHQT